MDGELLATDTARFATLKKLVDIDLADRREWFGRAERNRTERFKRTNTKKPVYEGAQGFGVTSQHSTINVWTAT